MSAHVPGPDDTRGILDPDRMRALVRLNRYEPGEALHGLVDWFWAVSYHLPPGAEHVQRVLTHPGSHLSVGTVDRAGQVLDPAGARVYGVHRGLDSRRLVGHGWTVAAKTSGGLGVLTDRVAATLTDAEIPMDEAIGVAQVARTVREAGDEPARVAALRTVLEQVVQQRPRELLRQARDVTAVAALAERERSLLRVQDLASAAGVGVRTLQRLFIRHLGVAPTWVIRRWRIIEAADRAAASGQPPVWAGLAADLGYADQAHLVRDFAAQVGTTPAAYCRTLTATAGGR